MRAAMLLEPGAELEVVDDVEVEEPRAGEVRIDVSNCGVCHSDMTILEGGHLMNAVLGHEAAGVIESVGPGVSHVGVGDKVLISPVVPCGNCEGCARLQAAECESAMSFIFGTRPDGTSPLSRGGEMVLRGLGVGGFAQRTVVPASGAVRLDDDVPLEVACLIGCGVQTGVGAVLNTAQVRRGSTVVVMGLGGVGISAVQGARIAGAARIIASDPVESRRQAAARLGATDTVAGDAAELRQAVMDASGGRGADYVFETAGIAALVRVGIDVTAPGGTTVVVGAPPPDHTVDIGSVTAFMLRQTRLVGSLLGGCWPHRDIPLLAGLWRRGELDLESMITARVPLAAVNTAFDRLRTGEGVRTVVDVAA